MKELTPQTQDDIRKMREYAWVTNKGQHLRPKVMGSRHLFNTVIMLWHHFMPAEATLYPHKRWTFSNERYTPEYIETSIRFMLPELLNRDDLTTVQGQALEAMYTYLRNTNHKLLFTRKEITHAT